MFVCCMCHILNVNTTGKNEIFDDRQTEKMGTIYHSSEI